jgi:hypothetical protein
MSAIKKANRNQKALIPKNSASPPHTPATTLSRRDLRKDCLPVAIFTSKFALSYNPLRSEGHRVAQIPPARLFLSIQGFAG